MNPLIAFASLVVVLPLQQAPDLNKKISFESVAMPAKRLVEEFGKLNGLTLDTSGTTASEVLVVRFSDVPMKEALDRIAEAVNGEWKQEEEVLRLVRSAATANREAAAERQHRLEELQKEIRRHLDQLNKKPPKGEGAQGAAADFVGLAMSGDAGKHILTLVSRIPIGELDLPTPDSRVVFSSQPTRMQRLLPGDLRPIVAELVAEHSKALAAARAKPEEGPETEEERRWAEFMKSFGIGQDPKPMEGRPAKLLLVAEQQALIGGLSLGLQLYDSKGKVATQGSLNLGMGRFVQEAQELTQPRAEPAAKDQAIEFSATTKEMSAIFESVTQMGARKPVSKELEAKLLRPDLHDPLSFGPSESLLALAKARTVNLVASLPDSMSSFFGMFTGGPKTVNAFFQSLQASEEVNVESKPNWILVRPLRPVHARSNRTDRLALARLVAVSKARGTAPLDDVATYSLTSPSPMNESAAMPYFMFFAPNAMQQGMTGMPDWNALRFYGTLDISQRQALAGGGRIPFSRLTLPQRGLAEKMLFGPQSNLTVQDPNAKPKEEMGFMELIRGFMGGQTNDFRQEPTEIMPNGLPMDGYLTARITKEPVGRAVSDDPMLGSAALGADELAMFRFFKEDPNFAQMAGMMPVISQIRLGERTSIELKLWAAADVALERTLQDNRIDANGPVVSVENLPAEFKDRVEKRYQAFKKTPFPMLPGMGRGVPPPK